jgi:protein tyrosine phosphatase type 4A
MRLFLLGAIALRTIDCVRPSSWRLKASTNHQQVTTAAEVCISQDARSALTRASVILSTLLTAGTIVSADEPTEKNSGAATPNVSVIQAANMKFIIADAPTEKNLASYLSVFSTYNVKHVVRIDGIPPVYNGADVEKAGITMHEMFFAGGADPPPDIIAKWLSLVSSTFDASKPGDELPCIAVHCITGVVRAPLLVAVALVEHGIAAASAVALIRNKRPGAINAAQLKYLDEYQARRRTEKTRVVSLFS